MSDPDVAAWLASVADIECCHLTTVGRRTGRHHEIEIWFGAVDGELCLISGNGPNADWYRNLLAEPHVEVQIGDATVTGTARAVSDPVERRRIGDIMGAKYVWGGDPSIGLTYVAWCYDVPAASITVR